MKKYLTMFLLLILSLSSYALTITSDENGPVYLPKHQLQVGDRAPIATLYNGDYKKVTFGGATGRVQVISTIESFNTPVCDQQSMILNKLAKKMPQIQVYVVTTNQPFIVQAFQQAHKLKNIHILSAFNNPRFGTLYGVQVIGGELTGITARSIFVVNKKGRIVYKQLTHNIDKMPHMKKAIKAVKKAV